MPPMEETRSPPPAQGSVSRGRILQTSRTWLLAALALIARGVAGGLAIAIRPNTTAGFWTATSVVKIGMAPNVDSLLGSGPPQTELIENARTLVITIGNPQFIARVAAKLTTNAQQASDLLANLNLRAVVLDDSSLRLEVTATSQQEAISALNESISLIRKTQDDLIKPKLDQIHFVRDNLQASVDWLTESLKTESAEQKPSQPSGPVFIFGQNDRISDRIVDLKLKIGLMDSIQYRLSSTGPDANLEPILDGPRQANLPKKALLAGLGALLCAIILTFFIMNFLPRGTKDNG